MFHFRKAYFLTAALLLVLEVFIAVAAQDAVVRPYGGDFIATIFVYRLIRCVVSWPIGPALAAALLVSYLIEGLQYVHLLHFLGLEHLRLTRNILGSSFAWGDILAYTLGALAVLASERLLRPGRHFWQCQSS
jgi:hypothetical protein